MAERRKTFRERCRWISSLVLLLGGKRRLGELLDKLQRRAERANPVNADVVRRIRQAREYVDSHMTISEDRLW